MARILIVEDDRHFAHGLRYNLARAGYDVEIAYTGPDGLDRACDRSADLVVLDLMLPGVDGFEILGRMRRLGVRTPVIILSARGEEADKVRGFDLGATDYVTKPVGLAELLARIRARLPRASTDDAPFPAFGGTVRPGALELERDGECIALTPTELHLLRALHARSGDAVRREDLLGEIWGVGPSRTRTLDTHITRLRKKLEPDPARPVHLLTVHGVGYRLCP